MLPHSNDRIRPYFLDDDPVIRTKIMVEEDSLRGHSYNAVSDLTSHWLMALVTASICCTVFVISLHHQWNTGLDALVSQLKENVYVSMILFAITGVYTFIPYLLIAVFTICKRPIATFVSFLVLNGSVWGYFFFRTHNDTEIQTIVSIFSIFSLIYFGLFYRRWLRALERIAS